jgi:hypothetical protein
MVYPYIILLPEEYNLINRLWGASIILIIITNLFISLLKNNFQFKLNLFYKIGFALLFLSTLSIIFNGLISGYYFWFALKYYVAFFIAAAFYEMFNLSKLSVRILYYISLFFLLAFFVVIFWRLNLYNFNIGSIIINRDEIWLNKPVVLALIYASFYYLFVYFTYAFKKPNYLKYVFIWPLFIMGARSVLIGAGISVIIFFLNDFIIVSKKYIQRFLIAILVLSAVFAQPIFEYVTANENLMEIAGSGLTQKSKREANLNNLSSGRVDIIQSSFKHFRWNHILIGEGRVNPKVGYVTHNDFLDMFLQFGLIAGLVYFIFFIKQFGYRLWQLKILGKDLANFSLALSIFILIQSLFNPFLSTLSSIYFFILVCILFKQAHENYRRTKHA